MHLTPHPERTAFARTNIVRILRFADAQFDSRGSAADVIDRLVRIAIYVDADTSGHVQRVAGLARALALECGWTGAPLDQLTVAAFLHDIGKIGVAASVLQKPGPLDPTERLAIQRHTTFAAALLRGCRSQELRIARAVATHHHERWDGTGYPHLLAGTQIPAPARIVALADVFDALTSDRPYRPALSTGAALALIGSAAGTQFDPDLTDAFLSLHGTVRKCA